MEPLKQALDPVIRQLPDGARAYWALILGVAALLLLLVLGLLLRGLGRALFGRKQPPAVDADRGLREDLALYPPLNRPAGESWLTVYHVPVRLRLVVVASAGKDPEVEASAVERLLDQVLPGLGDVVRHDRPRIRVWPSQLSHHGFAATFFRRTSVPDSVGQPSHWVLVAGRAQIGHRPLLLGLGLWAEEPNTLGRLELEPHQIRDVLRLKNRKD